VINAIKTMTSTVAKNAKGWTKDFIYALFNDYILKTNFPFALS